MTRQVYTANDITYTVAMDDRVPPGLRPMALVRAVLVDELTGQPPRGSITLATNQRGLSPRVADDGLIGWAGIPREAFSSLRLQNYDFHGTVDAARYVPLDLPIHVPMNAQFPSAFVPVDLGPLDLHRLPTVISGRVVDSTGPAPTTVVNATISMTGLWRVLPPAFLAVAPDPVRIVSLVPALYFRRTAAASTMATLTLQPVLGQDKRLLFDTPRGSDQVRLSDSVGLNPGDRLAIDFTEAERTEYMTVQSLAGTVPPNQPRSITLSYPLKFPHRPQAPVRKVTPQGVGVNTPFLDDAIAGDSCVFLQTLANLPPALPVPPPQAVVISGGPVPDEFHMVSQFATTSDLNGFFRLPPMSRVAQIILHADGGALGGLDATVAPDYAGPAFRTDFVYE